MEMRKMINVAAVAMLAAVLAVCTVPAAASSRPAPEIPESAQSKPKKELKEVVFTVSMHCENCVKKIKENISFEKGVKGLEVSLDDKTVKITYDPSRTDETKLAGALKKLGYEVEKKA